MPASIFKGSKVKTLKQNLTLNDVVDIQSGTVDPTSVAVDAPQGSLYLNSSNGITYRKLDAGSSTNWVQLGSGGASGINYITNPDAEANTTGWVTYADGSATPVDLTGGSPNVWSRSTLSPLKGLASFLFTAGSLGDGVAFTITPDPAEILKGSVQTISFDYSYTATVATGAYTVWVYDVANSQLIQPAGFQIPGGVAGAAYQLQAATFQLPTNGTTFRVAIHQAVASPGGNLKVDSISVGPVSRLYGAPITDMTAFTPTWAATSGSAPAIGNGTIQGFYRRVGDSVQIRYQIVSGTTTTYGNAGWYTFSVPTGLTIDTAKLNSTGQGQVLGFATTGVTASINIYAGMPVVEDSTKIKVRLTDGASANNWGYNTPATFTTTTAGQFFSIDVTVPIVGFSSTVEMSSSTDTRIVSFRGTQTSEAVIAATTNITFIKDTDTFGAWSTNVYTVPVPGDYVVSASVVADSSTGTTGVFKNGSVYQYMAAPSAANSRYTATTLVTGLKAGDTLSLRNSNSVTISNTTLVIYRLSGPSAIAASETVAAKYRVSSSANMASGSTYALDFATKDYDTHGAVSNAGVRLTTTFANGWKFTAPISGKYSIKSTARITSGTFSATTQLQMSFYVDGVEQDMVGAIFGNGSANAYCVGGSSTISLLPGQTLQVAFFQNSGSNQTLFSAASFNHVEIERVGN
jgi:hypothetical protein